MQKVIIFLFCLFGTLIAKGTHIRCGHITLVKLSGLTYRITLFVYTNTATEVKIGDGDLDFGDGTKPFITPTIDNTLRPDLGANFGTVTFSINHTFPSVRSYIVSYRESNLDGGIVNVSNSVETSFYLESGIFVDASADSSSPEFLTEPNFKQQAGQEYSYSTTAVDKNDYRLTYELVTPLKPGSSNFSWPENISVNYYNGLVPWDTKYKGIYQLGEYLFAVRVTQYNQENKKMGYVIKTFQVILVDDNSQIKITNPISDGNGKIVVENGQKKTIKVLLDNTAQQAEWVVAYDKKINNNFSFSQYDSVVGTSKLKVGLLKINSSTDIVRDNPYAIHLRAKASAPSGWVFSIDISYLFFTKDVELPIITEVFEKESDDITAYPNPFSDFLKIDVDSSDPIIEFELLNSAGQLISRSQITKGDLLETSNFIPGLYILQTKNARKIYNQKLIKK